MNLQFAPSKVSLLAFMLLLGAAACGDDDAPPDAAIDASLDGTSLSDAQSDGNAQDTSPGQDSAPADGVMADSATAVCGNGRCEPGEASSCEADCGRCAALPNDATDLERQLVNMEADTWMELPDSLMRPVCVPDSAGVRGVGGCPQVIKAWSTAALDTNRRRMLVWGGGHADYLGNEVYSFHIPSGTWRRLTEPSSGQEQSRDPLANGAPVSRHTYDGVEYVGHADMLFASGGSRGGDGWATNVTWVFNGVDTWTDQAPDPIGPGGLEAASAYDPASRMVIYRLAENLYQYDLDTNTWTRLQALDRAPEWPRYARSGSKTGTIDTRRGLFWSVGNRDILVWDIAEGRMVTDDWVTSGGGDYTNTDLVGDRPDQLFEGGGGDIYNAGAPGFDYDAAADAMVAWVGEGGPWRLDLETRTWSQGNGEGAPISMNSGGTFGRWRYVAAYNVFVLINSVEENVRFYKNTRCMGRPDR